MNPTHNDHTYDAGCAQHTHIPAWAAKLALGAVCGVLFAIGIISSAESAAVAPAHNFTITPEPTYGISVSCTFDNTPVVGDGAVVSQGEVAGLCHDVNVGTANQALLANSLGHVVWSNGDRLGAIATRRRVVIVLGGR